MFRLDLFLVLLLLNGITISVLQLPTTYTSPEEKLPVEVAPQPVTFSHKQHNDAGMACLDCHENTATGERAGLPSAEDCILCHSIDETESLFIQDLANLRRKGTKIAWVRVYWVPDYVFFSHASHVNADVECHACHGPVEERDVLAREVSTSMTACMNCHAVEEVSNSCYLCHDLGQ